jgi:hypothetical protein
LQIRDCRNRFADHLTSSVRQLNAHTPIFFSEPFKAGASKSNDLDGKILPPRYPQFIGRAEK